MMMKVIVEQDRQQHSNQKHSSSINDPNGQQQQRSKWTAAAMIKMDSSYSKSKAEVKLSDGDRTSRAVQDQKWRW